MLTRGKAAKMSLIKDTTHESRKPHRTPTWFEVNNPLGYHEQSSGEVEIIPDVQESWRGGQQRESHPRVTSTDCIFTNLVEKVKLYTQLYKSIIYKNLEKHYRLYKIN